MKLRFNSASATASLAVGVLLAGGVVWASGGINLSGEAVCRTKAGYLRVSSTGECRRSEIPVELPRGEQGPQGEPGVDGRDGSDANVESVRCFQRLTRGVDLSGCDLPVRQIPPTVDLSQANLESVNLVRDSLSAQDIASGEGFACASLVNGHVKCWGRQYDGALREYRDAYWPLDLVRVRQVVSGGAFACALIEGGAVRCWGWRWNGSGHVLMETPAALTGARVLSAGLESVCAVDLNHEAVCWGYNGWGVADVPADLGPVNSVAVGGNFACAIEASTSRVRCWGRSGILEIPADTQAREMTASRTSFCIIGFDEKAKCWGPDDNAVRQVPSDLGSASHVSVADNFACALNVSGQIRCWGTGATFPVPTDLGPLEAFAARNTNICALTKSGFVSCFMDQSNAPYPQVSVQATVPMNLQLGSRLTLDISDARVQSADFSTLRIADMWGCGISGLPAAMPKGWSIKNGCVQRL